jgi:hypothetical protein
MSQLIGKVSISLKEWFLRVIITLLFLLFFLDYVKSLPHTYALSISVICSILSTVVLVRFELIRTFSLWFAAASLFFILQFFLFSDANQLLPTQFSQNNHSVTNKKSPVYIFLLDELPLISLLNNEKKLDASRFPTLTKFSQESTWYPNALAISSATEMAIPSILSGIEPNRKRVVGSYEQYPVNLFTLFSPSHAIHAVENTTRMCPSSICKSVIKDKYQLLLEDVLVSYLYIITPKDLQKKLPPINDRWVGYLREIKNKKNKRYDFSERKNTFTTFINDFDEYPENTVHFMHVLLPHAPWNILPDLKLYGFYESEGTPGQLADGDPNARFIHQWTNDEWATRLSWRKHLLQVGAIDALLKKAFDRIRELNQFDEATIVVLADHGSAFIPNLSRRLAHDANIPDIAAIPLFIKYPKQKTGTIDNRHASNVDVLATLLDVFDIKSNKSMPNYSLIAEKQRDKPPSLFQQGWVKLTMPDNYDALFNEHLSHKNEMFSKKGWSGVYRPKDSNQFINLAVSQLDVTATFSDAIHISNKNLFTRISKTSQYVPAYYRLNISKDLKYKPKEILLAINNKITSHCYVFKHAPLDCAGLIEPSVYNSNKSQNSFRFFSVISKEGTYKVIELLSKKKEPAKIITVNKQRFVHYESHQEAIEKDIPLFGNASIKLINNNATYQIYGWAGNTLNGEIAKRVSLFIDNKLFTTVALNMPKPYLVNLYGFNTLGKSGFEINFPVEQFPNLQAQNLVILATNQNDRIAELNYTPNPKNLNLFSSFDTNSNRPIPVNPQSVITFKQNKLNENILFNKNEIDAFDDEFPYITAGDWYKSKQHRLWIGSSVYVSLPQNRITKTYQIDITAKPLLYKNKVNEQKVEIYLNDKLIKQIVFDKNKSQHFTVVFDSDKKSNSLIKLYMPDAVAPSVMSNSVDSRFLSLYVSSFSIKPVTKQHIVKKE